MNEITHVTISIQQLTQISNEVARKHVLQMVKEIQEWKDNGRSIENYLLVKNFLYTYNWN